MARRDVGGPFASRAPRSTSSASRPRASLRGSKCTSRVRAPGTASKKPSGARLVSDLAPATALRLACSSESSGYSTSTAPSATSRNTGVPALNPKSKIENPKSSPTDGALATPPQEIDRYAAQHDQISRPGRAGVAREKEGDESEPRGGVEQRQVGISGSSEGPPQIGSAEAKDDDGDDEQNVEEKIRRAMSLPRSRRGLPGRAGSRQTAGPSDTRRWQERRSPSRGDIPRAALGGASCPGPGLPRRRT